MTFVGKDILSKLQGRLFLKKKSFFPDSFTLSHNVQPITNADHFRVIKNYYGQLIAVGSTGVLNVLTVPVGKQWLIQAVRAWKVSGTFTMGGFLVNIPGGAQYYSVNFTGSQTTIDYLPAAGQFSIPEGWGISVAVDAFTLAGTLNAIVWVIEDDYVAI